MLDSGDFPSLNPGYYVVFSGVYKTLLQAETGARNARFAGVRLCVSAADQALSAVLSEDNSGRDFVTAARLR